MDDAEICGLEGRVVDEGKGFGGVTVKFFAACVHFRW